MKEAAVMETQILTHGIRNEPLVISDRCKVVQKLSSKYPTPGGLCPVKLKIDS